MVEKAYYLVKKSREAWEIVIENCLRDYELWALKFDKNGNIIGRKPPKKYTLQTIITEFKTKAKFHLNVIQSHINHIKKYGLKDYDKKDLLVIKPTMIYMKKLKKWNHYVISTILYTKRK